jgi:hypothetical protein
MTPEGMLGNAQQLALVVVAALAGLSGAIGTGAYVAGKATNTPAWCSWGRGGWVGMGVGLAASGIMAIITNISQRVAGGQSGEYWRSGSPSPAARGP